MGTPEVIETGSGLDWQFANAHFSQTSLMVFGLLALIVIAGIVVPKRQRPERPQVKRLQARAEREPENAFAQKALGYAYFDNGDYEAAIGSFEATLALEPDWNAVRVDLATACQRAGDLGMAVYHYKEALGHEPQHAPALYDLATILHKEGQFTEAQALYMKALGVVTDPGLQLRIDHGLARVYLDQDDCSMAITLLQALLTATPSYSRARTDLASAFGRLGQPEDAIRECQTVLAGEPQNALALLNLGVAYKTLHRTGDAKAAFQQAQEATDDPAVLAKVEAGLAVLE